MVLQKYQARWITDFQKIEKTLAEGLNHLDINIHHIGSTAVPGLAAKPIIDIDISYDPSLRFERIKEALAKLGYYHNGDQGIPGREAFKRKKVGEKHPILDAIKHHLYVCAAGNEELRRHIKFRDYLRNNKKAREEYERLKYDIAEIAQQDIKEYISWKEKMASAFIESILKQ